MDKTCWSFSVKDLSRPMKDNYGDLEKWKERNVISLEFNTLLKGLKLDGSVLMY